MHVYVWPILLVWFSVVIPAMALSPKADFFVAPNGNDGWSGKRAEPTLYRKDGPFATLDRAQRAVREQRQAEVGRRRACVVLVRGGSYFLDKPLTFTPEDSGTSVSPVIYAAYPGESPVISGGRRITGWQPDALGRWQVHIPEVELRKWNFSQLFVNGQRRYRPRLPKQGYHYIAGEVYPSDGVQARGFDGFRCRSGEIRGDWGNLGDVEVLCFHTWSISRLRIASVEAGRNTVRFTGHTAAPNYCFSLAKGNRFLVENVKEALEDPGEWYLDRSTGILTYIPLADEEIQTSAVIAPRLERLVQLKGDVAQHRWVEHVAFRGLTFAHADWITPRQGCSFPQAEVGLGGAIAAEGARYCSIEDCRITQVGEYAVEWGAGCKYNRVEKCELTDLGAGGVKIGETSIREDSDEVASHQLIRNNLISHGGRIHPAAVGVWIGHSPHNVVEHNDICDFYYTGISVGWSWGYDRSLAHHNRIEHNHIYGIGQGVLSDMGGIYTLGVSPGTVLKGNLIHDVEALSYGGWGIYLDEGSSGIRAANNVVYRAKSGGFHQHYGKGNRVVNNVFALADDCQINRTREEPHCSFTFQRNIVYWKNGQPLGGQWSDGNFVLDHNIYWNVGQRPVEFGKSTFEQWKEKGHDVHSLIADPLFVNVDECDFRLKNGSPAARIGFKPFDVRKAGCSLLKNGSLAARDVSRAFPLRDAVRPSFPPEPIVEGYEDAPVGMWALGATTYEESPQATIRVTDEVSASGKHSLKFTDSAGLRDSWVPYIFYTPEMNTGTIEGCFSVRMEKNSALCHEWRSSQPGVTGPSVRVTSDGTVSAGRTTLTQIPHGRWVNFKIICPVGDQAKGSYEITITVTGKDQPLSYHDLPCDPNFKSLDWLGFMAEANEPAVFYLDDLQVSPQGL